MKKLLLTAIVVVCAIIALAPHPTLGQEPAIQNVRTWQTAGPLQNQGDLVQLRCDQDQSQAVIEIPATNGPGPTPTPIATGTPTAGPSATPGPDTATTEILTATSLGNSPGPFGTPLQQSLPGGATPAPTLSTYPQKIYLTLGADQFVEVLLTSPDPNRGTLTPRITCTRAVAHVGVGAAAAAAPAPTPASYDALIEGEIAAGLANYFPLSDASGVPADGALGVTLTSHGTVSYQTASLCCNSALSMTFPSTANYFSFGRPGLTFGAYPFPWTFEVWFEVPVTSANASQIFSNVNSGGGSGSYLQVLNAAGSFDLDYAQNGTAYDTGFAVSLATAYYLVMENDGANLYVFVNDTLEYAHPVVATTTALAVFQLGACTPCSVGGNGIIMQKFAFYSGLLNANARLRHYNCGSTNVCKWAWNS